MSLIKAFPEVEIFFSHERFTEIELLLFLENLEKKYHEKDIRKALFTLIELKILQYETFPDEHKNEKKQNIIARARPLKQKIDKSEKYHPLLSYLRNLTIENLAESIDVRTNNLIHLAKQKGIDKTSNCILDENEFDILKEMINSFLIALERKGKLFSTEKRIKNNYKNKSISKGYDVYSKIIANGGTGKLIYIRKI